MLCKLLWFVEINCDAEHYRVPQSGNWHFGVMFAENLHEKSDGVRGLKVHNFAGKFTVTTLLVFLMTSGLELNPGPNSVSGEASMDCECMHDDNSTHTEQCTTNQPTTMQKILQSVQSPSS